MESGGGKSVNATGGVGRIIAADVVQLMESGGGKVGAGGAGAAAPAAAAPAGVAGVDYTEIPHTNVRKVIARRLLESKTTVPHYYLSMDVCLDNLTTLRAALNKTAIKDKAGNVSYKLSVNDFIIKACALALRAHPEVNSSWMDNVVRRYNYVDAYNYVDVSVAVASPTGLITPIITDADMKGLSAISNEAKALAGKAEEGHLPTVKALAGKAKEGKLLPHEYQGGTFSVSNLGMFGITPFSSNVGFCERRFRAANHRISRFHWMFGITSFSAIINPPQSCILAIGAAEQRVVPAKSRILGVGASEKRVVPAKDGTFKAAEYMSDGTFKAAEYMTVTLSCDHRTVDGAVGATFLQTLKGFLQEPASMREVKKKKKKKKREMPSARPSTLSGYRHEAASMVL
ncbi:hypothetical protein T484DRAFT_1895211 [Baffinella frigidus]|nr:hypothetical protein T484DRAFT_1895211 [Cryptophyta sp. CCMP2293]